MIADHTDLIIAALEADATLTGEGLLGGKHVYRAVTARPPNVPSVTIKQEDDTGKPLVQQKSTGKREHTTRHQYHIWSRDSQGHCDRIEAQLEKILFGAPIDGTWDWRKVSRSPVFYDEDLEAWHCSLRFSYTYRVTDTI